MPNEVLWPRALPEEMTATHAAASLPKGRVSIDMMRAERKGAPGWMGLIVFLDGVHLAALARHWGRSVEVT